MFVPLVVLAAMSAYVEYALEKSEDARTFYVASPKQNEAGVGA